MKNILLIPFVLFNLAYSTLSFVGCNAIGGPLTINGKDIVVNNDTPVGTLLATFSLGSMQTYSCDNNNTNNMTTGGKIYGEFATSINGIRVYKTILPELVIHLVFRACVAMYIFRLQVGKII